MNEEKLDILRQKDVNLRDAMRMDEMELPQMPADLNARLMQRIKKESVGHKRIRIVWPWIAAACVAAFIVVYLTPPKKSVDEAVTKQEVVAKQDAKPFFEQPAEVQFPQANAKQPVKVQLNVSETPCTSMQEKPVIAENMLAHETAPAEEQIKETAAVALTERDIPITRPENYKYTPEELAKLKKQAAEAYLKWVELELEVSKYNLEQASAK